MTRDEPGRGAGGRPDQTTVATLPEDARGAFKEPLGPVFTDAEALLASAGRPLVAVGDVVTYHLAAAGVNPDVAVVDGRSEREAIDPAVRDGLPALDRQVSVPNEPATLSAELLAALVEAIADDDRVHIAVDGEEDLATLPAVLAAPDGATVVYGQPGEGMVRVDVNAETRARVGELVGVLETEPAFRDLLDA